MMSDKFDAARIRYREFSHLSAAAQREEYGEKNAHVCKLLNDGERFAVVMSIEPGSEKLENWTHYWLVVLETGDVIPYPVFEQACGYTPISYISRDSFGVWMRLRFHGQYAGSVIFYPFNQEGGNPTYREALAAAARKARGEEE